jgi:DNA-binding transcriptional LysR family regulator
LLYQDPVVVAMRPDHPFAGKDVAVRWLAEERLVLCERKANSYLFDNILALCTAEGFSPQIVNTSTTWSGVLTLVEAGEGVALVPSGVRHLRTKGLAYSSLVPNTLSLGLAAAWNPRNQSVALEAFLELLRENRAKIQGSDGS